MYAQPKSAGGSSGSGDREAGAAPQRHQGEADGAGGEDEDEDVKRFWRRIKGESSSCEAVECVVLAPASVTATGVGEGAGPRHQLRHQSALEKAAGIRPGEILNRAQLEERHPRLKNAPVQGGAYTADIPMTHKPFADLVRNVRCLRCGEWGHQLGDRECGLRHEVSAADLAMQRHNDPLNAMKRDELLEEKQKLILSKAAKLKQATTGASRGSGNSGILPANQQLVESDEEGISIIRK